MNNNPRFDSVSLARLISRSPLTILLQTLYLPRTIKPLPPALMRRCERTLTIVTPRLVMNHASAVPIQTRNPIHRQRRRAAVSRWMLGLILIAASGWSGSAKAEEIEKTAIDPPIVAG